MDSRVAPKLPFSRSIRGEFSGSTPTQLCQIVRTCVELPRGVIPAEPYGETDVATDAAQSVEGDPLSAA